MNAFPPELAPLLAPPDVHSFRRVLCVQPHPDDVEIGMGGIVAALADSGCHVAYLTATNGDRGNIDVNASPEQTAAIRRREAEAAGRHLGASEFIFLDHGDATLCEILPLSVEIARAIRRVKPDALFCPDPWLPYESHLDHIITGRAAANAFMICGGRGIGDEPGVAPHPVPAIGYYFTAKPNVIVDITRHFERKMESVAIHKSQIDERTFALYRAYFEARGRALGARRGFGIGEGVKLLSRLHAHCFAEAADV
ncbi:MAG: PIG-L family deacetylase [Oscillospiraceae bacterium]|nr:PIG-L family deacetylase [Oscillospiraceae bacterium]